MGVAVLGAKIVERPPSPGHISTAEGISMPVAGGAGYAHREEAVIVGVPVGMSPFVQDRMMNIATKSDAEKRSQLTVCMLDEQGLRLIGTILDHYRPRTFGTRFAPV